MKKEDTQEQLPLLEDMEKTLDESISLMQEMMKELEKTEGFPKS